MCLTLSTGPHPAVVIHPGHGEIAAWTLDNRFGAGLPEAGIAALAAILVAALLLRLSGAPIDPYLADGAAWLEHVTRMDTADTLERLPFLESLRKSDGAFPLGLHLLTPSGHVSDPMDRMDLVVHRAAIPAGSSTPPRCLHPFDWRRHDIVEDPEGGPGVTIWRPVVPLEPLEDPLEGTRGNTYP